MHCRYLRRTRLLFFIYVLIFVSCNNNSSRDNRPAQPTETSAGAGNDSTATAAVPPPDNTTTEPVPDTTATTAPSLSPDSSAPPQTGTSRPTRPGRSRPGGSGHGSGRASEGPATTPPRSIARPEDPSDTAIKMPEATGRKDSTALSTLAYSYFDSISENETKYIWAKIKSNSTREETVVLLKEYIEHVMAQPPKASDTNSIKSIFIKGYRYVSIIPDSSADFDIRLVDGQAKQEIDINEGNNWRWSVTLRKGVTTPRSSITLRIKATDNVQGLKDLEDQQLIMIDVKIKQPEANTANTDTSRHKKGKSRMGLIYGLIAAIILLTGILFRKKLGRMFGTRKKPQIFFSYAWGQEREKFVDQLYDSLKADGYNVIRDKVSLGYKGVISTFMTSIGKGQFIVVAISDKYLTSEYCMFELFEIFRNAKMEKEELLKRIYPVCIENLNLKSPPIIARYLKFWDDKEQEWEQLIKDNPDSISEEQQAAYTRVKRIIAYLGSLLDFLSDVNFLDEEKLSEDNFQQIKKAIENRIDEEDAA